MNEQAFFQAVLSKNRDLLRTFFHPAAVIDWPCTNERFTVEEYLTANCDYPGAWEGEICAKERGKDLLILVTRVWPREGTDAFHCVSFLRTEGERIVSLTEYWADDGEAPQWRKDLDLGRPIRKK